MKDDDDRAPAKEPEEEKPRKRRAKGKRKRKRAPKDAPSEKAAKAKDEQKTDKVKKPRPWIWLALLTIAIVELWMFGRRGHIELCVARQGEHDFALIGTPRTDENTRRYPTCEKRLNVGIISHFDEAKEDAMIHACKRATILRGKQAALECALAAEGWEHRETVEWCPPWHDHYYKRLFWFLD